MPKLGPGIWGWNTEGERRLLNAFSWLTRVGIGPKFGTMPIHYYQHDQVCALNELDRRAAQTLGLQENTMRDGSKRVGEDYEVKASGNDVYARRLGKRQRYHRIASFYELRDAVHHCGRK